MEKTNTPLKTPEQIKQEFKDEGTTIADWAKDKGHDVQMTYFVLNGFNKATRGKGHQIAVDLGMKQKTA